VCRMVRPRRGLVLGAGGVLGAAWTVGALMAVEEVLDGRRYIADLAYRVQGA
jgi:NTE family protein